MLRPSGQRGGGSGGQSRSNRLPARRQLTRPACQFFEAVLADPLNRGPPQAGPPPLERALARRAPAASPAAARRREAGSGGAGHGGSGVLQGPAAPFELLRSCGVCGPMGGMGGVISNAIV